MNSEERLSELFQSGVDLLKEGTSPVAAAQSLDLNGETAEFVQLFDIVETSYDLPHYKMPDAARAALLARLTAKTEERIVPLAVLPPTSTSTRPARRPTSWPRRPLLSWNWFLRIQQAVVIAALVVALGVIILQANQGTGSNPQEQITPAATAVPSPVITPTSQLTPEPQLTPGPVVTATAMPPATITAPATVVITQTTVAPSQGTPATFTSTSTPSASAPQPTSRGAVITQPSQNDPNQDQAPTKTIPAAPKTSTPTSRVIASPTIGAATAPKTVAPSTTKTNTQVAPTATVPDPTATAAVVAPTLTQSAPTATSQSQPVPTPAPPTQVQVPTAPPAATPTIDDHGGGGGGGGGSTKTASPTPQPTNTQKPSGNSGKAETPKPTG